MKKIRITVENHYHQGKPVEKGAVLEMDDIDAELVVAAQAGEPTTKPVTTAGQEG